MHSTVRHEISTAAAPAAARSQGTADAAEPRTRVMVVSAFDEDLIALLAIFSHTNWTGYWWTNRSDAVATLREHAIPVVICDADLPQAWQELLADVQVLPQPPRVIVTSRAADERLWAEALNLGAYDVLAKPFDAEEVFRVVALACRAWRDAAERAPRLRVAS